MICETGLDLQNNSETSFIGDLNLETSQKLLGKVFSIPMKHEMDSSLCSIWELRFLMPGARGSLPTARLIGVA